MKEMVIQIKPERPLLNALKLMTAILTFGLSTSIGHLRSTILVEEMKIKQKKSLKKQEVKSVLIQRRSSFGRNMLSLS
jgi:hypothetical protein